MGGILTPSVDCMSEKLNKNNCMISVHFFYTGMTHYSTVSSALDCSDPLTSAVFSSLSVSSSTDGGSVGVVEGLSEAFDLLGGDVVEYSRDGVIVSTKNVGEKEITGISVCDGAVVGVDDGLSDNASGSSLLLV